MLAGLAISGIILASLPELYDEYDLLEDYLDYLNDTYVSIEEASLEQRTTPFGIGEGYDISGTLQEIKLVSEELAQVGGDRGHCMLLGDGGKRDRSNYRDP